ncbi:hypothetical protein KY363_05860 [Candidatus Woesearchaeota archaeon]|nr:hypothetical protein [Candidatus Woesearchaeota archaeon]
MEENKPTDNEESNKEGHSLYGAGTARKHTDAWYVRAGRKAKSAARKAVIPVAIALGMAGAAAAGFSAGEMYERYTNWSDSLEQRILYKRDEISVTRKNGSLYLKRDIHIEQQINTSAPQNKLIYYDGKDRI